MLRRIECSDLKGFWADVANHRAALHTSFTATRHAAERWQLPSLATPASQAPLPRSCGAGRTDPPGPRPYCTPHRKPQSPLPQALVTFSPQTTNHKPSLPANHFCYMYSLFDSLLLKALLFVVDATLFVPVSAVKCTVLPVARVVDNYCKFIANWGHITIRGAALSVVWAAAYERTFSQIWRNWNHSIYEIGSVSTGICWLALFACLKHLLFALTDSVCNMLQISTRSTHMIALFVVFVHISRPQFAPGWWHFHHFFLIE